jgi:hypothetical protein
MRISLGQPLCADFFYPEFSGFKPGIWSAYLVVLEYIGFLRAAVRHEGAGENSEAREKHGQ